MDEENTERRRHKRIAFIKEVEVVGVGMRRCSDLGIDGMYLETVHSVPVGSVFEIQFKLNDSDPQAIKTQACVIYIHQGLGMGLSFVNMKKEDMDRIQKFVVQAS